MTPFESSTVAVTGVTGFVGAHVARELVEAGARVRGVYRDAARLSRVGGLEIEPVEADVLDAAGMRRALHGADVVFHVAGFVGSRPVERAWQVNALAPRIVVEAAGHAGARRVVLTSTSASIGPALEGRPVVETDLYRAGGFDLTYCNSKHEGELEALAAGARAGVEVVVVNPSYVLGAPVDRSAPGETSTRAIGNYLRGRAFGFFDGTLSAVDVRDVARAHVLAAERGRPGERYILGGHNMRWSELYARVAELSFVRHPLLVLSPRFGAVLRALESVGIRTGVNNEGPLLMSMDWRCSSQKAERELGYVVRPLDQTLEATIAWYHELIFARAFADARLSVNARMALALQAMDCLRILDGVRLVERLVGRRLLAAT